LARMIGNKRVIRLKQTWHEPSILWCAIVGKTCTHKSPSLDAATALLAQKQAEAVERYNEEMMQYEQDRAQYDREFAHWKRTKGNDQPPWEPKAPVCERYIVSDITMEALAERLSCQSDGVLLVRDELAG